MAINPASRRRLFRLLRIVLPTLAIAVTALTILWPQLFPTQTRLGLDVPVVTPDQESEEAMVDAVYSGVDRQGRPFTVTAARVRSAADRDLMLDLLAPDARLQLQDGTTVAVVADEGIYDRKNETLNLRGNVTLRHGADLTTRTEQATIDLNLGIASGARPVAGEASFGTIAGQGFRVSEQGAVIAVGGPARLTLNPGAKPALP